MKYVYLVRHAQSFYDSATPDHARPLTSTGRKQADALARLLSPLEIEEIHSSPYRRCLDTIRPFARASGLDLNEVDGFRERTFTRDAIDDWPAVWRRAWTDFDFAFPDGESSRQAQGRMYEATRMTVKSSRAQTMAISSHGNTIGLLLHHLDSRFTFEHASAIRNPDVLRLTFDGASLRWDPGFAIEELTSVATSFETKPRDEETL